MTVVQRIFGMIFFKTSDLTYVVSEIEFLSMQCIITDRSQYET